MHSPVRVVLASSCNVDGLICFCSKLSVIVILYPLGAVSVGSFLCSYLCALVFSL